MAPVLGLREDQAVARGHQRAGERRIGEIAVARAVAEAVADERVRPSERQAALQRQRVAAAPAAGQEPQVHAAGGAHARIAAEVEPDAAELVGAVGRYRAADGGRYPRLGAHVVAPGVVELRAQQPAGRRLGPVVARVVGQGPAERRVVAFLGWRVEPPRLAAPEARPGIAGPDARL